MAGEFFVPDVTARDRIPTGDGNPLANESRMRNLATPMTGNLLTLLASVGTLALVAFAWRSTFGRPVMIRVRTESTPRRSSDDASES